MRKKGATKVRVVLYLQEESKKQLRLLEQTFNLSPSSVVAQAIARWLLEEPLLKNRITTKPRKLRFVAPNTGPEGSNGGM